MRRSFRWLPTASSAFSSRSCRHLPAGYRRAGSQAIRVDLAEKILRAAFEARAGVAGKSGGGRPPARFAFDLDADGQQEQIARLAGGSGYLALDRNRNGRIDDGSELFGPQSGNGFTELARLDSDGNGWIDAADPGFARLALWQPAADGKGTLQTLGDAGIGALALAHLATPFELRDENNKDLGAVKSGGFFISESGKAGSMQEVDLSV